MPDRLVASNSSGWRCILILATIVMGGCATDADIPSVGLTTEPDAVPEAMLLDVGVIEFSPGLPGANQDLPDYIYPDIRRAEARYFPFHLKNTLQMTGHWGAVRVIPDDNVVADLYVSGEIRHSDGERAEIRFTVRDVTGKRWLRKSYDTRTDRDDFSSQRDRALDPYQNIFNEFANDLYAAFGKRDAEDIAIIRTTSRMKFYADMAPSVYADYIEADKRGRLSVVRLPASNDPMAGRLDRIRERDALFLDTLNEHYANFYYGIALPYADWRESAREAELEYQRLRRSALLRGLAGIAVVAAASEMSRGDAGDSGTARRAKSTVKNYAMAGGFEVFLSAFGRWSESRAQRQSIAELTESFGQEAAPMVIEVDGQTQRLTGTASAQYDQWRELLRQINAEQTGFDDDPRIGINGRASDDESDDG